MTDLRGQLRDVLALEFLNETPTPKSFRRLVELVREVLPGEIEYDTLEDSLRHLAGVKMSAERIDAVAWRMAGNYKRLKQRRAVPPWHVQRFSEWVAVQAVSAVREKTSRGRTGVRVQFRVLTGTPAGRITEAAWSMKYCRFLSRDFGFSKYARDENAKFPFAAPEQLVGLRMYARISPEKCDKSPGFDGLGFPTSIKVWNKTTLKCRFRIQPGFACLMMAAPSVLPCHKCPVGFIRCRGGTHRQDWVEGNCEHCKKENVYFDPEWSLAKCVNCRVGDAYKSTGSG